jgi:hypothetical protein
LASLPFGSGAVASLAWSAASYDTNSYWDISDPNDINITVPGIYTATAYMLWPVSAAGFRYMSIAKNGTGIAATRETIVSGDFKEMNVAMPDTAMAAGDVIQVLAFQNSGGTLTIADATLSVRYVGSL